MRQSILIPLVHGLALVAAAQAGNAAPADPAAAVVLPTGDSAARALSGWAPSGAVAVDGSDAPCSGLARPITVPALGRETSPFGVRADPLGLGVRLHAGIDLAAPQGSNVVAAGAGEVLRAQWARGYGNLVVIDHGQGLTTRYAHLERALVRPGQAVGNGDRIGLVGATGHATGSHLHFEIRVDGRAIDPEHFVIPGPFVMACPDLPQFAPALGEVAPKSGWSEANRDGTLSTPTFP